MSESGVRRIGLVTTELSVGGAERCLVNLATGLDRERFAPFVIALAPPPVQPRTQLVERLGEHGIEVEFLGVRSVVQFGSAVGKLRRQFRRRRPELVQSFLFHANVVAALAVGRRGPRLVTGIRVADPRRWRLPVERMITQRANRIVCVSRGVADYCRETGGFSADKLLVIPNGLDVDAFPAPPAADVAESGGDPLLVAVGRLDRQKGIDWLLDQMPQIVARSPHARLLLVGDGPEREALQRQAGDRGIAERVTFYGWRADAAAVLAAADLYLLPSRWEGMPNTLLEAMGSGKPVLAADVSGVRELLGDDAGPQVYEAGNPVEFQAAIGRFVENRAIWVEWGKRNRRRVEQRFSVAAMVDSYQALYRELLP